MPRPPLLLLTSFPRSRHRPAGGCIEPVHCSAAAQGPRPQERRRADGRSSRTDFSFPEQGQAMTGQKMNWDRARLHGKPTQDYRVDPPYRRRPLSVQSPPPPAYRARSMPPSGGGCLVEIIELPQAQRFRKVFAILQLRCPDHVPVERWKRAVEDGKHFLAKWGALAESLGWDARDLFGLAPVPADPHPSYSRMSRVDCMGLVWLLQRRRVTELTATAATIRNPKTGVGTVLRKHRCSPRRQG